MNKKYDLCIFIGRFQPFHNGHQEALRIASTLSRNILILIGSATGPRTIKNPWTYNERVNAIHANVQTANIYTNGLNDYSYNDNKWIQQVGEKVESVIEQITPMEKGNFKIAVIGHDKDHTSYYLNYFPQWKFIETKAFPSEKETISSTKIRQLMFNNQVPFTDGVLPGSQVKDFVVTDTFIELQKEWNYIQDYNKAWNVAPYPPTFVTVDAVVEQSGHILLIQRGGYPGKGQWAMPGGFINITERLKDGVVRELREETKLKVPEKVLRGSITHQDVFDEPNRSTRGRTITHAFLFQLDDAADLPKVKGNDDAMDARWVSLAEFENMQDVMYEDHYSIIKNMLGRA